MIDIADIEHIQAQAKLLLAERKKYERLQSKWSDLTPKQAQKLNADLNWQAMHLAKIEMQLHVACVDAGIADIREPSHYGRREFNPSGWHRYNWVPPQPKGLNP